MALSKKLMCFKTQANFDAQLAAGEINDYSIVFIQDTQKIWTHQTYFGDLTALEKELADIYTKEEVDELIEALEREITIFNDALENKQNKLSAGDNITIADNTISASQPTLADLSGISTVSASGTSPLTLSASKSGTSVSISGSVDLSNYATTSNLSSAVSNLTAEIDAKQDTLTAGDNITISNNTISAKDTTYSAGSNVSISDSNAISVDLSNYATTSSLESGLAAKQDTITAGTGLAFDGNTLNCTIDDTLFVVVTTLPSAPAEGDEHKIHLVPLDTTGDDNKYAEYLWVNSAWEKFGELSTTVDLSGYYTSTQIDSLLSDKQDKLTAGSNISISGNTISATDTTYSGGSNVNISSSNVISVDLSNYVTSSSLSTSLGNYLPLSGGTLTGPLTANAECAFNDNVTFSDYWVQFKGDYVVTFNSGSSASEVQVNIPILYNDAYGTVVTDPSSYDVVVAQASDGKLEKSSFSTVKTAIVGDLESKIDSEISDREAVIVSSEDDTYVLKQVDASDNLLIGFKTNGEMDVPVGLSDDAYALIYALYEKLEKLSATVESLC